MHYACSVRVFKSKSYMTTIFERNTWNYEQNKVIEQMKSTEIVRRKDEIYVPTYYVVYLNLN